MFIDLPRPDLRDEQYRLSLEVFILGILGMIAGVNYDLIIMTLAGGAGAFMGFLLYLKWVMNYWRTD